MVRDIGIDLWHCAFTLGGSNQASHILVVQCVIIFCELQVQVNANSLTLPICKAIPFSFCS